jgi:hypothetical protein
MNLEDTDDANACSLERTDKYAIKIPAAKMGNNVEKPALLFKVN